MDGSAFTSTTTYPGFAAGTYAVEVRDANSCTFSTTASVSNTSGPTAIVTTVVNASCGASNGSITLGAVTGGVAPYTYSVDGSTFTSTTSYPGFAAGTYAVEVRDANSCTFSTTASVSNTSGPTAIATTVVNAACGASNGSITLGAVTGGVAPYTYSVDGSAFTSTTTYPGFAAGTYAVEVRDANSCTFSTTASVSNTSGPTAIATTVVNASCGASNGSITLGAVTGGVAPYTYSVDGSAFTSTTSYPGFAAGTYAVEVRDANGCTFSTTASVSNTSGPTAIATTVVNAACGASNGSITLGAVTGGVAPYTYSVDGSAFTSTTSYPGFAAGTYAVEVRDSNGCTFSTTASVSSTTGPTAIVTTIVNAACGASNGSITLGAVTGGVAPYTYSVDGSAFTSTTTYPGFAAGAYAVEVRDANSCTFSTTASVSNTSGPTAIATTIVNASCGASNGSITLGAVTGGVAPYTYSVDGSTFTSTTSYPGFAAGTYTVEVRDANGCTFSTTASVSNTSGPTAIATTVVNAACGASNGSITLGAVTGGVAPYTYSVDGSAFTSTTTYPGFAAGAYAVEVRDANSCTFSTTASVSNTSGPTAIATTIVNASCGASNGSITLGAVTGGVAPYTYSVDGSAFTSTTSYPGFAAGTYAVEVRDANGCTFSTTASVSSTSGPTAIATTVVNAACGTSNGSITLGVVTGGVAPYTYSVDGSAFTSTTSYPGFAAGTYSVDVRDVNGCTFSTTASISNTSGPTAIATTVVNTTCGASNGSITLGAVTGGVAPYTYSVDGSAFTSTTSYPGFTAGTYSVDVSDANGCIFSTSVTITNTGGPTAIITNITSATCGASNGSITLGAVTEGVAPYTYSVDGSAFTSTASYPGFAAGTYAVEVRDANDCIFSTSATVTDASGPTAIITNVTGATCGASNGTLSLGLVTGGAAPYTYSVDGGPFTATITYTGLAAGTHPVDVRDANGCSFATTASISSTGGPTAIASTVVNESCGAANGSVTLGAVTGGVAPYTYSVDGSPFTSAINYISLTAGTHTVDVRDANGCTFSTTAAMSNTGGPTAIATTVNNATCGASNGSVTLGAVTGGVAPYTFSVNGSAFTTTTSYPGFAAGTYSIDVRDANNCTFSTTASISSTGGPTAIETTIVNETCGASNGSVTLGAVTGGVAPYTFSVDGSAFTTTTSYPGFAAGTYSIDVRDAIGCTFSTTAAITNTSTPELPLMTLIQPTCSAATGTITVTSPAESGMTYSIDGVTYTNTTGIFTSVSPGTYTITARNSGGCTSPGASGTINSQPETPVVTDQITSILSGSTFSVTPAGVPATTTYSWTAPVYTGSVSGGSAQAAQPAISQTLTGTGTATYSVTPVSGACTGTTFTVTVTVTAGCIPVSIGTQPVDNSMCASSGNASFGVVATGTSPFTYQWEYNDGGTWAPVTNGLPAGAEYTGSNTATLGVAGITTAGSYEYRAYITNCSGANNATTNVVTLTVNLTPAIVITNPAALCSPATADITLPEITAGSTTGLTYSYWLDAAATVPYTTPTAAASNTYYIKGITASGCFDVKPVTVTISSMPIVSNQTASIISGGTFSVTPAGVPPGTTYTWTAPAITGGVTGGIAQPVPQSSISGTLAILSGAGTATYTVTPASGSCIGASFNVTVNIALTCAPVIIGTQPANTEICGSPGIGSFTVFANGTAPFTYQWEYNNGGTWESLANGTPAGAIYTNMNTATLTVAGITTTGSYQYRSLISNCGGVNNTTSNVVTLTVDVLSAPTLGAVTQPPSCDSPTGSVVLNGLPATGNWTINPGGIIGSGISTTISNLSAGTYSFTVSILSGCTSLPSANVVIISPPGVLSTPVVGTITQPSSCAEPTGSVELSGLPVTGTWTINPGSVAGTGTTTTIINLRPGTYNFTVTSEGGCTSPATADVAIGPAPEAPPAPLTGTVTQPSTCAAPTGSVVLSGLPATGVWTINPGSIAGTGTTTTITNLIPGSYNFYVTSEAGCISFESSTVVINAAPVAPPAPIIGTITQPASCAAPTGSVILTGLPATGTWTINPGSIAGTGTSTTITNLSPGTYFFNVTSEAGCISAESAVVVINRAPVAPTAPIIGTVTQPSSCTSPMGSVVLSGLPATGTWIINPGAIAGTGTTTIISNLDPGTYNFNVTSEAGCISRSSADVIIHVAPTAPTAPIVGTITQPSSCSSATGSVVLTGLPSTGAWNINPGGITGTGTSVTITNLAPGIYNFTIYSDPGCISHASADIIINPAPAAPAAPLVGTITQPSSCTSAIGSVVLNGLPSSGTWIINPGAITGNGTSTTISNLIPGTYNFSVTTAAGCISRPSADVVINAAPVAPTAPVIGTITQPSACAASTGTVVLNGLPATGTWTINPGAITGTGTSATITNLNPGTYHFNITTSAGCISLPSTDVVINDAPGGPLAPVISTITQPASCTASTGSVILTGLPATGVWTINPGSIAGTGSTATITNLVPGSYNFYVTSEAGCISLASATVVIKAAPVAPAAPVPGTITQPSSCAAPTGSVILTGLPATGVWTINPGSIAGTGTSTTLTNLSPGTYNFNVTSEAGCISDGSAAVVINPAPVAPTAPIVGTVTQPSSCTSPMGSVVLSGLPATGIWIINPGAIAGTGTSTTILNLDPGTYNFNVTSDAGCISRGSADVIIHVAPSAPTAPIVGTVTQPSSCSSATGSVVLTGLPATGTWTINPGGITGYGTSTTITNLAPGRYNFTVYSDPGCISHASADIIINAAPSAPTAPLPGTITQPSSCTLTTGSVVLNGLPSTGTWTINPGAITGTGTSATISNLLPGTYNFSVTAAAGCISRPSADVVINAAPVAPTAPVVGIITQPSACATPTGTVVLNGLPPAGTWTINPGGITGSGTTIIITNLIPGTYNFTVTSDAGCVSLPSTDVVIISPPGTPATPRIGSITQPSSCASPDGSVVLYGLPISETWTINPGSIIGSGASTTIASLPAGTYNYTVTIASGCTSLPSADVVIVSAGVIPATPVPGTITQPASCASPSGSVVLNGLPASETWTINPGAITGTGVSATVNALLPGTYNFTVTIGTGCPSLPSADVIINAAPAGPTAPVAGEITQPVSCENSRGTIVLNGLPATGTWTINPGAITGSGESATLSSVLPGIHNFTVTDALGCTSEPSADIVINAAPGAPAIPVIGSITQPNCALSTGTVILNGMPATGTWTINPGSIPGAGSIAVIPDLAPGTYSFNVTNADGCTSFTTDPVTLIEPQPLGMTVNLSVSADGNYNISCAGANTGSITIEPLNNSGPVTYLWSDGATGNERTGLTPNTYRVILTDSNNCQADSSITLLAPDPLALIFDPVQPLCPGVSNGGITLTVTGGVPASGYSYLWSDNSTGANLTNIPSGTYEVKVTDANGCSVLSSYELQAQQTTCLVLNDVFSPNGDGINDVWNIGNTYLYPDMEVTIYNRWGQSIWKSGRGYPVPWDGTNNGAALAIDSYHYVIELHNGSKALIGAVTIVR